MCSYFLHVSNPSATGPLIMPLCPVACPPPNCMPPPCRVLPCHHCRPLCTAVPFDIATDPITPYFLTHLCHTLGPISTILFPSPHMLMLWHQIQHLPMMLSSPLRLAAAYSPSRDCRAFQLNMMSIKHFSIPWPLLPVTHHAGITGDVAHRP